jgi:hypothetical protein
LQISIDYNDRVTAGVIKPGRHRGLFSEISREVKDTDVGISRAKLLQDRECAVAAAIIDVDGFPLSVCITLDRRRRNSAIPDSSLKAGATTEPFPG